MKDMDVKAILENGDEIVINGPILAIGEGGKIFVRSDLFSCTHGGKDLEISINELIKAEFSNDFIALFERKIADDLPSAKRAWLKLLSKIQDRQLKMISEGNVMAGLSGLGH